MALKRNSKEYLETRINAFKSPKRRRREMMLVAWEQTKSLKAISDVFAYQLGQTFWVSDLDWLVKSVSTDNHKWKLHHSLAKKLYFITDGEFIKIGVASSPKDRLAALQTSSPRDLSIIYVGRLSDAYYQEQYLHKKFAHLRVRGEWFKHTDEIDNQIRNLKQTEDYLESRQIYVKVKLSQEPAHTS